MEAPRNPHYSPFFHNMFRLLYAVLLAMPIYMMYQMGTISTVTSLVTHMSPVALFSVFLAIVWAALYKGMTLVLS